MWPAQRVTAGISKRCRAPRRDSVAASQSRCTYLQHVEVGGLASQCARLDGPPLNGRLLVHLARVARRVGARVDARAVEVLEHLSVQEHVAQDLAHEELELVRGLEVVDGLEHVRERRVGEHHGLGRDGLGPVRAGLVHADVVLAVVPPRAGYSILAFGRVDIVVWCGTAYWAPVKRTPTTYQSLRPHSATVLVDHQPNLPPAGLQLYQPAPAPPPPYPTPFHAVDHPDGRHGRHARVRVLHAVVRPRVLLPVPGHVAAADLRRRHDGGADHGPPVAGHAQHAHPRDGGLRGREAVRQAGAARADQAPLAAGDAADRERQRQRSAPHLPQQAGARGRVHPAVRDLRAALRRDHPVRGVHGPQPAQDRRYAVPLCESADGHHLPHCVPDQPRARHVARRRPRPGPVQAQGDQGPGDAAARE
ncbi:hypothetical protein ON010_g7292 [Phytophthora cinnamomi]|nr:hypothetical protein ON010_g7292 [Phytophthora cinnamomi]